MNPNGYCKYSVLKNVGGMHEQAYCKVDDKWCPYTKYCNCSVKMQTNFTKCLNRKRKESEDANV